MSLQERIFGLETEYAVNFYPSNGSERPDPMKLVRAFREALWARCGIAGCDFLMNGGKFYHDIGHAEWATPECRSAREVATYDKAIDHLLAQMLPEVQQALAREGIEGVLFIAKNNVDSLNNTYGCHENYLMLRETPLLVAAPFFHYLLRTLVPFLVTRQIFLGTGHVLSDSDSSTWAAFSLSQRSPFIDTLISTNTRKNRSIINLGREDETLAADNYRRLHLILGDSNLSGWATWLKLGTTGIVLRMIEDMFITNAPVFVDPVEALHVIAKDPTCSVVLPLRDGRRMTAKDIQWLYFELADDYLAAFGASPEEDDLVDAWGKALEDMEHPASLRGRVDWVTKKGLLDAYLAKEEVPWYNIRQRFRLDELKFRNLCYHDISAQGLFHSFFYPDTLVTEQEIMHAQTMPPPYTRARVRGGAIRRAREQRQPIAVKFWMKMVVNGRTIPLTDPLQFDDEAFPFVPEWWTRLFAQEGPLLRISATQQLAQRRDAESLKLLMERARHDEDAQVRRAAVEALGWRADKAALEVLKQCLTDDKSHLVQWAAEEALSQVRQGVPRLAPVVRSSQPGENESPVQFFL